MNEAIDPETGLRIGVRSAPYPTGPATVASVLDAVLAEDPQRIAMVDGDQSWSYEALDVDVRRAAGALLEAGIEVGDRVAWSLDNGPALPIGFLACERIGAIWLGLNTALADPEFSFLTEDAEPALVIADDRRSATTPATATHVAPEDWDSRCAKAEPVEERRDAPELPGAIAYTSGTTGRPKGAVHSQHNLLWPGIADAMAFPPAEVDRVGTPHALTILNMMVLGPVTAWCRGGTAVVMQSPRSTRFAHDVERHLVSRSIVVPTVVHDLVNDPDVEASQLISLDRMVIGGAGTPAALRQAFTDKFGLRPVVGYGLSEVPTGAVREPTDGPIADGPIGVALDPFEVDVVDDDGPVGVGEIGEIVISATASGPWANVWEGMLGYWRRPDETAAAFAGGVLHTGDLGRVDADGRLEVKGRASEMILRGGANIYPAEVEAALLDHPDVRGAAAIAVPDDRLGARVGAVLEAAADIDTAAVAESVAGRLARYKVPDVFAVVDELPRNAMGKVVRADLLPLLEDRPDGR